MIKNRKKRVAVVEDEQAIQKVLVEWLESEGYEALGITDGQEALEVIPKQLPDLVLLDIVLPEVNGFKVMKELKKNPKTADIPVIVMTNLGDNEDRKQALDLGARDYLIKAEYDFPAIKEIISEALRT